MPATLTRSAANFPASVAAACALALFLGTGPAQAQSDISLSGVALDKVDDNRFFARVGGTVRDDVTYEGLTAGQTYTLAAQLYNTTTEELIGDVAAMTFTPDAPSGSLSIELPVPQNRTDFNIDFVVYLTLYEGEVDPAGADAAEAVATLADASNIDQTVQLHAIQSILVTATDAADGDRSLPPEGGTILATVEYVNLVEGYHYTVWGQLLTPSGQARGIYASVEEFVPEGKNGSLTLEFTVPEGYDGTSLVPTVGLFHQNRVEINDDGSLTWLPDAPVPVMIASDLSLDAEEQTIEIGIPFAEQPPGN